MPVTDLWQHVDSRQYYSCADGSLDQILRGVVKQRWESRWRHALVGSTIIVQRERITSGEEVATYLSAQSCVRHLSSGSLHARLSRPWCLVMLSQAHHADCLGFKVSWIVNVVTGIWSEATTKMCLRAPCLTDKYMRPLCKWGVMRDPFCCSKTCSRRVSRLNRSKLGS